MKNTYKMYFYMKNDTKRDLIFRTDRMGINSAHLFYGVDGILKEADFIDNI